MRIKQWKYKKEIIRVKSSKNQITSQKITTSQRGIRDAQKAIQIQVVKNALEIDE